jgi:hypothetical protein
MVREDPRGLLSLPRASDEGLIPEPPAGLKKGKSLE